MSRRAGHCSFDLRSILARRIIRREAVAEIFIVRLNQH